MPEPIVSAVNAAFVQAIADPEINQRIITGGQQPATGTPAELSARIKQEQGVWGEVIKKAGIKAN